MKKNTFLLIALCAALLTTIEVTSQNDLRPKEKNGKWGYVNQQGEMVIYYQYEQASWFNHSAACVKLKGKYGLINQQGQFLLEPSHDSLAIKADAVVYAEAGLFGLMDTLGNRVTEPLYQRVNGGEDKFTLNVKRDGQWFQRKDGVETPADMSSLVFSDFDEKPTFLDCKDRKSKDDKIHCGEREMLQFIYGNIKYPVEARKNGVEGTVYVGFIVSNTGKITDIKVLRDVGGGTGDEAARVIQLMPDWVPGKVEGVAVGCRFNMPVKFKLQ